MATELTEGLERLDAQPELKPFHFSRYKDQFLAYLELLKRWNRTYNLTAVRDDRDHVIRHLLDSLVIAPFVSAHRFADVGSGGGLPGIPLAICDPNRKVVLIDANGKKTRFLTQAKIELGLNQVEIIQSRIEALGDLNFKQVVCRAFKPLDELVPSLSHVLDSDGVILAMIGKKPDEQVQQVVSGQAEVIYRSIAVPGLEAERCLAEITPKLSQSQASG